MRIFLLSFIFLSCSNQSSVDTTGTPTIATDSCAIQREVYERRLAEYVHLTDSLKTQVTIFGGRINKIKRHLKIALGNKSQRQFLAGWVARDIRYYETR